MLMKAFTYRVEAGSRGGRWSMVRSTTWCARSKLCARTTAIPIRLRATKSSRCSMRQDANSKSRRRRVGRKSDNAALQCLQRRRRQPVRCAVVVAPRAGASHAANRVEARDLAARAGPASGLPSSLFACRLDLECRVPLYLLVRARRSPTFANSEPSGECER